MKELIRYDVKGNDTGVRVYATASGLELAVYYPEREERWGTLPNGKKVLRQRAHKAYLSININRTRYGGDWWSKTYLERIKPELEELLEKYGDIQLTEHSYV